MGETGGGGEGGRARQAGEGGEGGRARQAGDNMRYLQHKT